MRYRADPPSRKLTPAGRRIGVPRALGFDELRHFFDTTLQGHGFEVVFSPPSSAAIAALGGERCIDEVCLPLKLFFGHVAALIAEGVDTVLVPRLCSLAPGRNLCPKFHLLPDLIEQAYPEVDVLAPFIDLHHSPRRDLAAHLVDACRPMLEELGVWRGRASRELLREALREDEARSATPERARGKGDVTIALVGHHYAERDRFLGLGVGRLLRGMGARTLIAPRRLPEIPGPLEEGMYYESVVRSARAIEHHLEAGVDGVLLLTFFACGPDSYGADTLLYRLEGRGAAVPVMRLILDEHTSVEGLSTRLTTFVEMCRGRRDERGRGC
ncbi:MAG: hypothetical protein JRI55_10525 [Deltaproteobacteria bacterium]|jgi:predicted nucleotide-binding protein (sugar kinase/HSP70/actin superfamily)|nr:hypothetical protein [Deltaproteobacteria bacterium]